MCSPDPSPEPWIGVVLAGGRSRRMGRDKALLDFHGRPLLAHQCEVLRAAGAARVVISGDRPEWEGIPDAMPDRGPLGGVAAVMAACPGERLLFIAVDMPRLPPDLLMQLARDASNDAAARFAGQPLPLCLRATPEALAQTQALIDGAPPYSLQRLAAVLEAREVPLAAACQYHLFNANTPSDWAEVIHETAD